MVNGYRGKMLHVDLTHRRIEIEEKEDAFTEPISAVEELDTIIS